MGIRKVLIIEITALALIGVTLVVLSTGLLVAQKTTSSNGSKGYRKFRKNAKALSPVIAMTILIAVTVAVSVVVAAWMGALTIGFMGNGNFGSAITSSVNTGVYSDEAATLNCTNINWGTLTPGSVVSQTVYVENLGNTSETLSMSTSGWSPASANTYLTLTWNQAGTVLPAGSVVAATLTLTVASNTGNLARFSFNIVISGSSSS